MINYFISYRAGEFSFGNLEINRNRPIHNYDDIIKIQKLIQDHRAEAGHEVGKKIVVTDWRRFE